MGSLQRACSNHPRKSSRVGQRARCNWFRSRSQSMYILLSGLLVFSLMKLLVLMNKEVDLLDTARVDKDGRERRREREAFISQHPVDRYNNSFFRYDYNTLAERGLTTLSDPLVRVFDGNHTPVVVLVLSTREHAERRHLIRDTWGKGYAVYFVIGGDPVDSSPFQIQENKDIQRLLELEQSQNLDLIDSIHPESYSSLPHKLKYALNWINDKYYTNASSLISPEWIVKVDEDAYVRVAALYHSLLFPFSNLGGQQKIWIGSLQLDAPVYREGKWAENGMMYSHKTYPTFALGSCGYALNHAVAQYIAKQYKHDRRFLNQLKSQLSTKNGFPLDQKLRLQVYQGEDVSLGIWLEESHFVFEEDPALFVDSPYFMRDGDCSRRESLSVGHRLSANEIEECYRQDQHVLATNISGVSSYEHQQSNQMNRIWFIQNLAQHSSAIGNQSFNDARRAEANYFGGSAARQQQRLADETRREKAIRRSKMREERRKSLVNDEND